MLDVTEIYNHITSKRATSTQVPQGQRPVNNSTSWLHPPPDCNILTLLVATPAPSYAITQIHSVVLFTQQVTVVVTHCI